MKLSTKNIALELLVIIMIAIPLVGFAQAGITDIEGIGTVITRIINVFIGIFWAVVLAFGLWAAVSYLTAGGDEDKIKTAKKRLIYLVIAIAIAVSLTVIRTVLEELIGGTIPIDVP